jgi:hypothetical protein
LMIIEDIIQTKNLVSYYMNNDSEPRKRNRKHTLMSDC